MRKQFLHLLNIAIALQVFSSCEKKEIAVPKHLAGAITDQQLNMGEDYRHQLFYNLNTNQVVRQNLKTDWDLAFEASKNGWHLLLNSSTGGAAANAKTNNFESDIVISSLKWNWDAHSRNLDSTAIGDWRTNKNVIVIDRGYNYLGQHLGYEKMMIESVNDTAYQFRHAPLDGSKEMSFQLKKDSAYNFITYSFTEKKVVAIQPKAIEWHLLFTQYIHLFSEPTLTPYLVTGVLINGFETTVAVEKEKDFSAIRLADVKNYHFHNHSNGIGYDWKWYDLAGGSYTVYPTISYIIRTSEGVYFKLHFIDFYDTEGKKGAPKFEVQEL